MAAMMSSRQLRICLLLYSLLSIFEPHASSLSFSFNFSNPTDPCGSAELTCEGSAFHRPVIDVTENNGDGPVPYSVGRVSYPQPVRLWDNKTGELASFTTNFSFRIYFNASKSSSPGDGMAFFLAHFPSRIPPNSVGGSLGLTDRTHDGNATGDDSFVAVEFDTKQNVVDSSASQNNLDSSGSHIGVDVNSVRSVAYTNVSNMTTGEALTAWISYDNATRMLAAVLRINRTSFQVNARVDLRRYLPEEVAVGFSASTGLYVEVHELLSWTFNSTLSILQNRNSTLPAVKQSETSQRLATGKLLIAVVVPVMFVVVACATLGFYLWRQRARKRTPCGSTDSEPEEQPNEAEFEKGLGPKRYRYKQLADATGNFSEEMRLGRGGFGNVYQGKLSDQDCPVAIKMLSSESSSQGRKEFEAEVKIISRLSHRNLVQLLGWCDSHKGLLLVYEFVAQGSLDRHIHSTNKWLTWAERYNIILGLGSALHYLHIEWEQCVVHGDIKPSNIMLDSSYNAKLGDFGLARLIDHGTGLRTTHIVLGTAGYIDPEFVNTQKQSKESDVYSFGIVLLEIVSGRRPVEEQPDDQFFVLLKWVWKLYGNNRILAAADERLRGEEFDEREMERVLMVGLWCAHPDRSERPSIAQAMHVLNSGDAPLPTLSPQIYNNAANVDIGQRAYGALSIDISSGVNISTTRSSGSSATAFLGDSQQLA